MRPDDAPFRTARITGRTILLLGISLLVTLVGLGAGAIASFRACLTASEEAAYAAAPLLASVRRVRSFDKALVRSWEIRLSWTPSS